MSQKKSSKEERFLFRVYEVASAKGDPQGEVDRYEVGKTLGERPKGVDHIVQMLSKNGLIKKIDEKLIYLTDFGINFVKHNFANKGSSNDH